MSIYRRYVSGTGLANAIEGRGGVAPITYPKPTGRYLHPIYITIPDEDAPEPPEVPDVPHRDRLGFLVRIASPPVFDSSSGRFVVLATGMDGLGVYTLDLLTPIEPAPERTQLEDAKDMLARMLDTYTNGGTGTYRQELVRDCEAVIARLEGSDE